ncbi:MAG: 50S ribosomal protein L4 [Clostridia bacterium]|nr:50S ribosomal protein L4 [Clostridia bacterium]
MQTKVYNLEGQEVEQLELADEVFGKDYNEALIHQAVVTYLANQRQGTKSTLTRAEVAGGGRKPWRQKGTGRARQGSIRSPQWVHGGVVFAPKPRDFSKKMNAAMKKSAFLSALSTMAKENSLVVVDSMDIEPKTKVAVKVLDALKTNRRVTVVTENVNSNALRAFGNLPEVSVTTADILNTYDLVVSDYVILTKEAVKKLEEGNK